ncbi:MAG: carbohydrate kinase family protein [Acidobacteria bacterium]|nr:carbohydrate kinase family protein [Acidobacteriota bacterium]
MSISTNPVAVIGELNVDLIATGLITPPVLGQEILATDFQMTLGSASAIFSCGVAKLGHDVTFLSRVGRDNFGKFCLDALREAGVSTANVVEDEGLKTGITISLSTSNDRALVTFLGAISHLGIKHVPLAALEGHSHLHLTSYFLQDSLRSSFPQIMGEAKRRGLTTSFDPNADPTSEWKEGIWDVLGQTDVLFLNESEALQLTRRDEVSDALKLLGNTIRCVVIKLGPRGAVAIRDKEVMFISGFKIETVDTTGAGDSFAAGFIHGFLEGQNLRTCLKFGNACGALSTLKAGGTANQPTLQQLNDFMKTHHDNE